MNRRQFVRDAAITSTIVASTGFWSCTNKKSERKQNIKIRWAMGWLLWRDFAGGTIPLSDAITDLSDLGVNGIEFSPRPDELSKNGFTRESFRDLLTEKNLEVSGNYFSGDFHDTTKRDEIISAFKKAVENIKFYGAKNIIIGPPGRGKGNPKELIRGSATLLNDLGKMAVDSGVEIGIHPHVWTIIETPDEIDLAMELTNPEYVFMSPDTAHIFFGGGNVIEILRKYSERLNYFHFKDAKLFNDTRENFSRDQFFKHMRELGQGEIDFPGVMNLLNEINYSGWIDVEQDHTSLTPRESAAKSIEYINSELKPIYN